MEENAFRWYGVVVTCVSADVCDRLGILFRYCAYKCGGELRHFHGVFSREGVYCLGEDCLVGEVVWEFGGVGYDPVG